MRWMCIFLLDKKSNLGVIFETAGCKTYSAFLLLNDIEIKCVLKLRK